MGLELFVATGPSVLEPILRRGYSDEDAKKILGLNVLRAMRGVETVAKRLQKQRPPSPALIEQLDRRASQN